jgi:hypothetical protein
MVCRDLIGCSGVWVSRHRRDDFQIAVARPAPEDGDVLTSGTPKGVAAGLGILRNTIV